MRFSNRSSTTAAKLVSIAAALAIGMAVWAATGIWPVAPAEQGLSTAPPYAQAPEHSARVPDAVVTASQVQLPMHFEANEGQVDPRVEFLSRGAGYVLHLTLAEAVLSRQGSMVRMSFPGANPQPEVSGLGPLPGRSNYLVGNDPEKWRTDVPHYSRVRYSDLYPGIDLVFYGNEGQLEYDFIVSPGADPSLIALSFGGAEDLALDEAGNLVLVLPTQDTELGAEGQELTLLAPVIYQEADGSQRAVDGEFTLLGRARIGFMIGDYDTSLPLVIDPVLVFSTYFGSNSDEQSGGIAVDDDGNIYVTGYTEAVDFPTLNAIQPAFGGSTCAFPPCDNVFVAKFNPSGTSLVFSTYLGGSGSTWARAIAVDPAGNAYIAGDLNTSDFPTVNAYQGTLNGSQDAFVIKLDRSGSSIAYATYLGGDDHENGNGIAVDRAGQAWVVGYTMSADFPTQNAFQGSFGGIGDGFVTKLSSTGSSLVYSTFLGGDFEDDANAVVVDRAGNAYVVGKTDSNTFPTVNPLQGPVNTSYHAFVTKLQPSGSTAAFSTYLGGSSGEFGNGIAVDTEGNVYVAGFTNSNDFPTVKALQGSRVAESDMFITKMNPAGSTLVYSTYLGGGGTDVAHDIAVDSMGNAHVVGSTTSLNFPTVSPVDPTYGTIRDAIVVQLNAGGSALLHSSHLSGSNGREIARGIAVDSQGSAYIIGETSSSDFPTKSAIMGSNPGSETPFIMKLVWPMNFWLASATVPEGEKAGEEDGCEH